MKVILIGLTALVLLSGCCNTASDDPYAEYNKLKKAYEARKQG